MPLNLHAACIGRLEEILMDAMEHLRVIHGQFLEWSSVASLGRLDEVLPRHGKQPVSLADIIDDHPASDFVVDRIQRRLVDEAPYQPWASPIPSSLIGVGSFADPPQAARDIVGELNSLPWDYIFSLRLPRQLKAILEHCCGSSGRLGVGAGISLATTKALNAGFPISAPIVPSPSQMGAKNWEPDSVYLQVPGSGYMDKYGGTGTARRAVEMLMTFLGLGTALGLFRYQTYYTPMAFGPPLSAYFVHRRIEGQWVHDTTVDLEATAVMGLEGFNVQDVGSGFDYPRLAAAVVGMMAICFTQAEKAGQIMRAAQWYAGGCTSRNETLAFVQTMVAMEILLGDKASTDMVGIGELLSNRCAYLIGESRAERQSVLTDFRELYAMRSKIVHAGKSRLSHQERIMAHRLSQMCQRALQAEINLLKKDSDR